ncbi:MAG: nucleotidyltransferase domain-containing protein [bacterium]
MSIARAQLKEKEVSSSVLDLLAYFAVMNIRLDFDTLYSYLPIKTGHLVVKKQLRSLIRQGKVQCIDNLFGLKGYKYTSQKIPRARRAALIKKAQRWSLLMRLIPAVKSIVVINSVAYGNVHKDSDIDLFIVTSPNRIFLTKGFLMYFLKLIKQLEDQQVSAGRFSLGMFVTTKGVKLEKDMMKVNNPDLAPRMITGIPVYGADTWYGILKNDPYMQAQLPNYIWPKTSIRIYGSGIKLLDKLDDIGYRRHLSHTASQPKTHHPDAFIRVRPDIINLHHKGTSAQIAEKWQTIRSNY